MSFFSTNGAFDMTANSTHSIEILSNLPLVQDLMRRDNMTAEEVIALIREVDSESFHPENTLEDLGIEPDFIFDLLTITGEI